MIRQYLNPVQGPAEAAEHAAELQRYLNR